VSHKDIVQGMIVRTLPGCRDCNNFRAHPDACTERLYRVVAKAKTLGGQYRLSSFNGVSSITLHHSLFEPAKPADPASLKPGDLVVTLPGCDTGSGLDMRTDGISDPGELYRVIGPSDRYPGQYMLVCVSGRRLQPTLHPDFFSPLQLPAIAESPAEAKEPVEWTPELVEEARNHGLVCFAGMSDDCRRLLHEQANKEPGSVELADSTCCKLRWHVADSVTKDATYRLWAAPYRLKPGFNPLRRVVDVAYDKDEGALYAGDVPLAAALDRGGRIVAFDDRDIPLRVEL
jgi:hypothetical protein